MEEMAILFESEQPEKMSSDTCQEERKWSVDMDYPKCDWWPQTTNSCAQGYEKRKNFYGITLWSNTSNIDLNFSSFMEMYVGAQLMEQSDFGFQRAPQFYYVTPGTNTLSTGPIYDLDGPYYTSDVNVFPDISTFWDKPASRSWSALGNNRQFIKLLQENGPSITVQNYKNIIGLYQQRLNETKNGLFDRHIERWPVCKRVWTWKMNIFNKIYPLPVSECTMEAWINYDMKRLETRKNIMKEGFKNVSGFNVLQTKTPVDRVIDYFMWFFVLGGISFVIMFLICTCACVERCIGCSRKIIKRDNVFSNK